MAAKQDKKTWPMLVGAIGFGIFAALLSVMYLKSREAAIKASLVGPEIRKVAVVVAKKNLPRGTQIIPANFAVRKMPENFVHDDAVSPGEFERYIGRSIIAPVGDGKTLLKSFMDEDFPVDFSDTIPQGNRALTVTVDEVNSVAGFIRPGNHIDLFVNIPTSASGAPDLGASDVILPVLQDVRVLATGRDPYKESLDKLRQPQQRNERNFTSVTLDLNPRQVALLAAAQDKGELLAVLRNRKDESGAGFTTVSAADLFGNASKLLEAENERKSRTTVAGGVDLAGNLVDAEGKKIMSREQLAAAGFTVNEKGEIVDKDGNVVAAEDLVVSADGTVMTRQQLAAAGLTVNESGQLVDASGNVVSAADVVIAPNGQVLTKQQMAAAGLSMNENGELVDASGKVVSADDVVIARDGTVMTKQQLAMAGLSINENGEIVDKNGKVVEGDKLANVLAEVAMAQSSGKEINLSAIDFILGGAGADGVPKITKLPITN